MKNKLFLSIITLIILFFIIISSNAFGKNYYVDGANPKCNDSANGVEVTPWCTLAKASSTISGGDTVFIKNGIYTETVVPKASGSSESGYITYEAYPGHAPVVDGQNLRAYGITIQNGSKYLKFKGLTIKNCNDGVKIKNNDRNDSDNIIIDNCIIEDNASEGIQATGSDAKNRLSNFTVQNCTIQNNKGHGIYVDDYWDNIIIENNTFYKNGHRAYLNGSCFDNIQAVQDETNFGPDSNTATNLKISNNISQAACRQGILVWGDINKVIVENNTSFSNGATGIQIEGSNEKGGPKNVVVRGNYVYDNCEFCSPSEIWSNAECGIWLDRTKYALVENNISRANNEGMHFSFKDANSYQIIRYNTLHQPSNLRAVKIWADSDYIHFYNNTIYDVGINGSYGGIYLKNSGGESDFNVIKNNIISQVDHKVVRCDITTTAFDYNLYYNPAGLMFEWNGNTYYSLKAWQIASNQDSHSIEGDPKFVNAPSNIFKLQESSPCIDAGGSLTEVGESDLGIGTSLIVNNAAYFQDGYGISGVHADWIAVGSVSNTAQISKVDIRTNTLILDSAIRRSIGDKVWLYRLSDGRRVLYGNNPDIGAYEYSKIVGEVTPPSPPVGLRIVEK